MGQGIRKFVMLSMHAIKSKLPEEQLIMKQTLCCRQGYWWISADV